MRRCLVLGLVVWAMNASAFYGGEPAPATLRELTARASHVVLAHVDRVSTGVAELSVNHGATCPPDATFRVGDDIVAFLVKPQTSTRSARMTATEAIAPTRELVNLAARLPKSATPPLRWIAEALSYPATRIDGTRSLQPVDPANGPSRTTMENLAAAFFREPTYDYTLLRVMVLLSSHVDARLDAAFAEAVAKLTSSEPTPLWTPDVINELARRDTAP